MAMGIVRELAIDRLVSQKALVGRVAASKTRRKVNAAGIAGVQSVSAERKHGRGSSWCEASTLGRRKGFVGGRQLAKLGCDQMLMRSNLRTRCWNTMIWASAGSSTEPAIADPSLLGGVSNKDNAPDEKLARLRGLFPVHGIDAYIVPTEDAHQSEFIADCFVRRAYISGFTGSAGTAIITKEKAALWTDGRYFLQAAKQLGPEWILMRAGIPGVPNYSEWLKDNLSQGSRVGIDPFLLTCEGAVELQRVFGAKDHQLVLLPHNLVDEIWHENKPKPPMGLLRVHDLKYAGASVSSKLSNLRHELLSVGATDITITMLDEVAWLFNLRGADVPHSPVTYAYAIIGLSTATLFVKEEKVTAEVQRHLSEASISIKPYEDILPEILRLAEKGSQLWLDAGNVSVAINNAFSAACRRFYEASKGKNKRTGVKDSEGPAVIHRPSPIALSKAVKNVAEIEGLKQAHLRDAAALAEFWAWLEKKITVEKVKFSEFELANHLLQFRAKQHGFLDTSFDTICGYGENGAIVHYRADESTCSLVDDQDLLLLDSGAQYIDGTTDITRTVHFGAPTLHQMECFTHVLKGHIAIDKLVFPENLPGFALDAFARSSLWKLGLDYRHGTGHGVGAALNVHEGPQSISPRYGNMTGLQVGMVVSNEPGYYEDLAFGIRIENLLIVREVQTTYNFGGVRYLGFEKLTFVPIQKKMLDLALLSEEEIMWINDYHAEVWNKVSPLVKGDALDWLQSQTKQVTKDGNS
ncbi:hypothetical protein O6H91_16G017600 [Diphasiastrum complanatum]|uniref:Uncharacterized protein n=1 Tax=Diphasiastrum complanatum TaxID=34168 RepID=A0ACC2BA55_DIPCM|nr:hypothetical protein O6H91_16G017600 [Diphasiastrum complanatum]